MIHRRLLIDDSRGVGEPLNELGINYYIERIELTHFNVDWDGQGMRQWVTHTLLFNKPGYN